MLALARVAATVAKPRATNSSPTTTWRREARGVRAWRSRARAEDPDDDAIGSTSSRESPVGGVGSSIVTP